jgi:histidine decarboxylase
MTDLATTHADGAVGDATTANGGGADVQRTLTELAAFLDADRANNIGFPSTLDIDFAPLWPFLNRPLNNVGDPFVDSAYPRNTKHLEREVLGWFADLLRAPQGWWGVTTTGGTEGILYGLLHARTAYPDALIIHSQAAHQSVPAMATLLGLPTIAVRAHWDGMLDLADLRDVIRAHRHRPLIVVATIGTTLTEAVDDVGSIRDILAEHAITRAWIHADAALSGLPLALLPPGGRPRFDLADGSDSISISAHKFLGGCPFPAGIYLTGRGHNGGSTVDYIATLVSTIACSRNGHAPLLMWYTIRTLGRHGLLARAHQSWQTAAYAVEQLQRIGIPAWRHPHGMTVVLPTPPRDIAAKWRLASSGGVSHLITVPGVTAQTIDALREDLVPHVHTMVPIAGAPAVPVPAPRSPIFREHGFRKG